MEHKKLGVRKAAGVCFPLARDSGEAKMEGVLDVFQTSPEGNTLLSFLRRGCSLGLVVDMWFVVDFLVGRVGWTKGSSEQLARYLSRSMRHVADAHVVCGFFRSLHLADAEPFA